LIKKICTAAALIGCSFTAAVEPAYAENLGCSYATHYGVGDGYHGKRTASGERFDAYALTAAHRHLPFGTKLKITDQLTKRSVVIRINDRGPFTQERTLDLSYGSFASITRPSRGITEICIAKI